MNTSQMWALTIGLFVATAGVGVVTGERTQSAVTEVSSCMIIDEPGTYVLTQDLEPTEQLSVTGGEPYGILETTLVGCLLVAPTETFFEPIIIDGNGHTIDGTNVNQSTPQNFARPAAISSFYPELEVTDVEVTGWRAGINSETIAAIDSVTARENEMGIQLQLVGGNVTNSTISANTIGIGVSGEDTAPYLSEVRISNNVIEENKRGGVGGGSYWAEITNNDVSENGEFGISYSASTTAEISGNTISKNGGHGLALGDSATVVENVFEKNQGAGVYVNGNLGIEIHQNRFEDNGAGVTSVVIEHREPSGDDDIPPPPYKDVVNATENFWGSAIGPASTNDPDAPFADPVTGALACGDGDTVSEGATPGVSNVRFDPWLSEPPQSVGVVDD